MVLALDIGCAVHEIVLLSVPLPLLLMTRRVRPADERVNRFGNDRLDI